MEITKELENAVGAASDYESLVAVYIQCRDEKEELKREITARTAPVDALMKTVEGKLLGMIDAAGVESVRTESGTIYKMPKTSVKVADWQVLLAYIKKHDAWDLLTKAVSKDAVKARIDANDEVVPGVDLYTIINVGIRRK